MTEKLVGDAQQQIEQAKERGMDMKEILSHDVLNSSPIFDGDCPADASKEKHNLVSEVEELAGKENLT